MFIAKPVTSKGNEIPMISSGQCGTKYSPLASNTVAWDLLKMQFLRPESLTGAGASQSVFCPSLLSFLFMHHSKKYLFCAYFVLGTINTIIINISETVSALVELTTKVKRHPHIPHHKFFMISWGKLWRKSTGVFKDHRNFRLTWYSLKGLEEFPQGEWFPVGG